MSLEAERRFVGAVNALYGLVKQGNMGHAQVSRQVGFIDGKTVVLRGDHHGVVIEIFHRMVATVMAKLHLHGFRTAGQRQQLMAKTDTKHRNVGFQESLNRADGVVARLRVARAIRQENPVRIQRQHLISRRLRRDNRQATAAIHQHAQNVALGAVVISHHVERQRVSALLLG